MLQIHGVYSVYACYTVALCAVAAVADCCHCCRWFFCWLLMMVVALASFSQWRRVRITNYFTQINIVQLIIINSRTSTCSTYVYVRAQQIDTLTHTYTHKHRCYLFLYSVIGSFLFFLFSFLACCDCSSAEEPQNYYFKNIVYVFAHILLAAVYCMPLINRSRFYCWMFERTLDFIHIIRLFSFSISFLVISIVLNLTFFPRINNGKQYHKRDWGMFCFHNVCLNLLNVSLSLAEYASATILICNKSMFAGKTRGNQKQNNCVLRYAFCLSSNWVYNASFDFFF